MLRSPGPSPFSVNDKGELKVDQSKFDFAEMSDDQKVLYKTFVEGVINNDEVNLTIKFGKSKNKSPVTKWKGMHKRTSSEQIAKKGVLKGSIFINVDFKLVDSKINDISPTAVQPILSRDIKESIILWHEIGHFVSGQKDYGYTSYEGVTNNNQVAVGYENIFRNIIGLPDREGNLHGGCFPNGKCYHGKQDARKEFENK